MPPVLSSSDHHLDDVDLNRVLPFVGSKHKGDTPSDMHADIDSAVPNAQELFRRALERDQGFYRAEVADGKLVIPFLWQHLAIAGIVGGSELRPDGLTDEEVIRVFQQGGSRNLSPAEVHSVRSGASDMLAYTRKKGIDYLNGAGGGSMREMHIGAQQGRRLHDKGGKSVGVTSKDIVPFEIPHPFLDELLYAATRDKRIYAMDLADGGEVVDGGVGTAEEVFTIGLTRLAKENHWWDQQYLFSSPDRNGTAVMLYDFLKRVVPAERRDMLHLHVSTEGDAPRVLERFVHRVEETATAVRSGVLHIPDVVHRPFDASPGNLEQAVNLLDGEPMALLLAARRITQGLIWSTVTNRLDFDAIGQIPVIEGSAENVALVKDLLDAFFRTNRIKRTHPEDHDPATWNLDRFMRFRVRKD